MDQQNMAAETHLTSKQRHRGFCRFHQLKFKTFEDLYHSKMNKNKLNVLYRSAKILCEPLANTNIVQPTIIMILDTKKLADKPMFFSRASNSLTHTFPYIQK